MYLKHLQTVHYFIRYRITEKKKLNRKKETYKREVNPYC